MNGKHLHKPKQGKTALRAVLVAITCLFVTLLVLLAAKQSKNDVFKKNENSEEIAKNEGTIDIPGYEQIILTSGTKRQNGQLLVVFSDYQRNTPATGDVYNLQLWACINGLSILCISVFAIRYKKSKRTNFTEMFEKYK